MKLIVSNEEFLQLDGALASLRDAERLPALVTLAWHLRQRNSKRALALVAEAENLLDSPGIDATTRERHAARLQLARAEATWLLGRRDEAARLLAECAERFSRLDDAAGTADTWFVIAYMAQERGDSQRMVEALDAAARAAQAADEPLRCDIIAVFRLRSRVFVDVHETEAEWNRRFAHRSFDDNPALGAWANDYLGISGACLADFSRAIRHAMRAYEAASATGQNYRAILGLINAGVAFCNVHDAVSSLECMQRALDLSRNLEWPVCIGLSLSQVSDPLRELGRHDVAASMCEEALLKLQSLSESRHYLTTLQHLGDLHLDRGRDHAALRVFEKLEETAHRLCQVDLTLIALRGRAHALSRLARPREALEAAESALALAEKHGDAYYPIEVLRVMAELHLRHNLPAPRGMRAPSAPLHFLLQALENARRVEGLTVPGDLLDFISREYAKAGDTHKAYQFLLEANAANTKIRSSEATNHAIAMQVMQETERTRGQLELQRQLAETEARRARTAEQMRDTLERIGTIGQDITANLEGHAVFDAIRRHVHGLLDVVSFGIYLMDEDGEGVHPVYAVEANRPTTLRPIRLTGSSSSVATCIRERHELIVDRSPDDASIQVVPGTLPTLSGMFGPLIARERVLGAMTIQTTTRHAYGDRERMIFRALCSYGAIALDNATAYEQLRRTLGTLHDTQEQLVQKNAELNAAYRRLEEMSVTDPLTGLRNRRFVMQQLDHDIAITLRRYDDAVQAAQSAPHDADLIFLMVDLDHFKDVNDRHGHAAGDAVLMQMRGRLRQVCRESDYLVRWGGEEFLVIARGTRGEEATVLAERIRQSVAREAFRLDGGLQLERTCSIGFAALPFLGAAPRLFSWFDVVDLADRALYLAKENGRNAWVGLFPESWETITSAPRPMLQLERFIAEGSIRVVSSIARLAEGLRTAG